MPNHVLSGGNAAAYRGLLRINARGRCIVATITPLKERTAAWSSPMSDETPLEMAERHVALGKRHIARQRELIAELKRDGHESMLPQAETLLAEMILIQAQFEQSLADHRAQEAASPREPLPTGR
jgi:hypothetical protein